MLNFFRDIKQELKLTEWLPLNKAWRMTLIIIALTILFGATIALIDTVFFKLRDYLLTSSITVN